MTLPAALAVRARELGFDPESGDLLSEVRARIDALCAEQTAALALYERQRKSYPMASSVLWRASGSPCDQRRSVIAAMKSPVVTAVLGGERSGKSQGLKELTLAMALGGDHPLVKAWRHHNELPNLIPPGPAQTYAVALTSNDSLRYHRPDFDTLVGELPHVWRNRNGVGECKLEITVPGYERPAIIHFKSIDQKAKSFQGISLRWVWIDEEPEGDEGRAVYGQCRARVMDQDGRIGISMVPMNGYTWVYDDLVVKGQDRAVIIELDALDNPHFLSRERAELHYASMSEDERAIRRFGRFRSRDGAIYPLWSPGDGDRWGLGHVCEDFEVPPEWPRFVGADFGLSNPTAVVWGAVGDDDTLYIYREYYKPDGLLMGGYPAHAANVVGLMRDIEGRVEPISCGWGDPAAPDAIADFAMAGLALNRANNAHKAGYSAVNERLRLRGGNRPRLKVFRSCTNTIREVGGLVKDPKRIDVEQIKRNDHAADALRYLCTGLLEWYGIGIGLD